MPFGEDKAITLRPEGLAGIEMENASHIQDGEDVGCGEVPASVSQVRMMRHGHRAQANPIGFLFQPFGPLLRSCQFVDSQLAHSGLRRHFSPQFRHTKAIVFRDANLNRGESARA